MCFTLHQVGFFNCNDFTRDPVSSNYWWLSITTLSLCMIKVLGSKVYRDILSHEIKKTIIRGLKLEAYKVKQINA
jgi:hypothetical protein